MCQRTQMRDGDVKLGPGEVFMLPGRVEHRPVAEKEVPLLPVEPAGGPDEGDDRAAARIVTL